MHRLTEITGEEHYAEEADKTATWWMANTQTSIGLYPWGTHTYWSVTKESGGGTFEFNHVWPYWRLNPQALQKYANGAVGPLRSRQEHRRLSTGTPTRTGTAPVAAWSSPGLVRR